MRASETSATAPARLTPAQIAALALFVAGGVVALIAQDAQVADRYMTDDAFISFRYAKHLAEGAGPVWSPGNRVEGYTNFGWVLALAVAMKAGFDPIDASRALGLAASAGILASVPFLATQFRERGSREWWALTVSTMAALAVNTGLSIWTFAGLETSAFTLFVTLGVIVFLAEERRGDAGLASAVLLFIAALIRPDGVVVFAVAAVWRAAGVVRRRDRRGALRFVAWAAAFAVPFGVYWGWRWWYYGDFFSNTYYLKTGTGGEYYERGMRYVRDFIAAYWAWLGLATVLSIWRERREDDHPSAFAAVLVVAWFAYVAATGGDWMPYFRFLLPIVPLLYALIANGLIDVAAAVASRAGDRAGVRTALAMGALLVLVFSSVRAYDDASAKDPSGFGSDVLPGSINVDVHRPIGLWLRDNLPPGATVAQIATGIVPYYSDLPTLDMLGVNDRYIARQGRRIPYQPAGHDREDGAYVLLSKPEAIWLSVGPEAMPRRTPDDYRPPIDERIAPVITDVSQNLYLWVYYRPVAIPVGGGWLNLLVRNDVEIGGRR